jgi:hypothetical protein
MRRICAAVQRAAALVQRDSVDQLMDDEIINADIIKRISELRVCGDTRW